MIRERIMAGLRRTTKKSGRKPMPADRLEAIKRSLENGVGIRATARLHNASPNTIIRIAREIMPGSSGYHTVEDDQTASSQHREGTVAA